MFIDRNMTPLEIATELGLPPSTVRSWKARDKWDDVAARCDAEAGRATRAKKEYPAGCAPFQPRNKQSTVHGLFSKYLPEETLDIVRQVEQADPLDLLWDQILLAYASVIRAQHLMHVRDQQDMTDIITTAGDHSITHTVQFAWDKHAGFLQAQAKAQASLTKMLERYETACRNGMANEEQQARIDKLGQSIDIDKRRLEIDERKANMDPESEDETGIAYYPLTDESLLDGALPDPEGF